MSEDSSRAAWLRQARSYLRHADPVLARLIDDRPDFDPRAWMTQLPPMDLYGALTLQVTGQRLTMDGGCNHLDRIHDVTPSCWGCEDCLAQGRRDWVHLRICWERGYAGAVTTLRAGTLPRRGRALRGSGR